MKVILTKFVPNLGEAGDIVEVAPGYGRNFLIAKGLAEEATKDVVVRSQSKKNKKERQKSEEEKKNNKVKYVLEGKTILVRGTANEEGNLFGGIGPKEIVETILKRKKITIDPKQIKLPHHLKTLGTHEVMLHLGGEEKIKFIVDIERTNE
jgi:large subunit ribosomal protein L9